MPPAKHSHTPEVLLEKMKLNIIEEKNLMHTHVCDHLGPIQIIHFGKKSVL